MNSNDVKVLVNEWIKSIAEGRSAQSKYIDNIAAWLIDELNIKTEDQIEIEPLSRDADKTTIMLFSSEFLLDTANILEISKTLNLDSDFRYRYALTSLDNIIDDIYSLNRTASNVSARYKMELYPQLIACVQEIDSCKNKAETFKDIKDQIKSNQYLKELTDDTIVTMADLKDRVSEALDELNQIKETDMER
jgi:hypothetical protein